MIHSQTIYRFITSNAFNIKRSRLAKILQKSVSLKMTKPDLISEKAHDMHKSPLGCGARTLRVYILLELIPFDDSISPYGAAPVVPRFGTSLLDTALRIR
jgi:hypothetical protein